jgi:hypothetical protein
MNVVLILDDQDQHGDCDCGLCNANGKSYGVGIYPATESGVPNGDVLTRVYACSEFSAMHNAKLACYQQQYAIVEPSHETSDV